MTVEVGSPRWYAWVFAGPIFDVWRKTDFLSVETAMTLAEVFHWLLPRATAMLEAKVHEKSPEGKACKRLAFACRAGCMAMARWLVTKYYLTDHHVAIGQAALCASCASGNHALVLWTNAHFGADSRLNDERFADRLYRNACTGGNSETLCWLWNSGFSFNGLSYYGPKLLRHVAASGSTTAFEWVISQCYEGKYDADLRRGMQFDECVTKDPPFVTACAYGRIELLKYFCKKYLPDASDLEAFLQQRPRTDPTASIFERGICAACAGGHVEVYEWLAVPMKPDAWKTFPKHGFMGHVSLHDICASGHVEAVRWLFDHINGDEVSFALITEVWNMFSQALRTIHSGSKNVFACPDMVDCLLRDFGISMNRVGREFPVLRAVLAGGRPVRGVLTDARTVSALVERYCPPLIAISSEERYRAELWTAVCGAGRTAMITMARGIAVTREMVVKDDGYSLAKICACAPKGDLSDLDWAVATFHLTEADVRLALVTMAHEFDVGKRTWRALEHRYSLDRWSLLAPHTPLCCRVNPPDPKRRRILHAGLAP